MHPLIRKTLAILGLALLAACASPAEFKNMVVTDDIDQIKVEQSPYRDNITVQNVDGGEETNPMWTSEISNKAFEDALIASLEKTKLLSKLTGESPYELRVTLLDVEQPLFGLNLTVRTRIRYEVFDKQRGATIFDTEIPASHTATFGDSPFAVQRLRLANEGSAKNNITAFINKLIEHQPDLSGANVASK